MITQIIINEQRDLGISNNNGDVEPFNSALKAQLFHYLDLITSDGIDPKLKAKRKIKTHIRKQWNYLPYNKFLIPNIVVGYLFRHFH